MRRWIVPLALSAALLGACGTPVLNPVTGKTERSVMSEADEIAQGRQVHQQVLQEYGALDSPRLQALVNDVGQRLARASHRAELKWTFTVLDSPEINAFALPGGYVYVTRGIMAYMADEADLAGVIGHEIGHVTARHGAQRATRSQDASLGVLAATVLGVVLEQAGVGGAANAAGQLSQTAAAGYIASYSREQETQADELGAEYLGRTRYDPRSMVDVIRLLRDQERFAAEAARAEGRSTNGGNAWLASHPSNDKRLADIQQVAARYPAAAATAEQGASRYLQAIDGMPFGESREQGVTRGRNFFHEPLGIALAAPVGWKVQNGASAIALLSAAGDVGVIVRTVPPKAGASHEEILRSLKVEQPSSERTQVNGLAATRFSGVRRGSQGQEVPVRGTLVTGPAGQHFLMTPVARDAASLPRAVAGLRDAEGSFRPLTAADRAAARPWVVRSTPFPRGGFAQLAQQSPLGERAEAQLRLLNGVHGGGEPKPGQLVKVVATDR